MLRVENNFSMCYSTAIKPHQHSIVLRFEPVEIVIKLACKEVVVESRIPPKSGGNVKTKMSKPIIKVENLSKQYRIGAREAGYGTFRESLAGAIKAPLQRLRRNGNTPDDDTFWALKDVSFEVQPGEVVGIIGRNGAGKSTLLKVLSRITEPTTGSIKLYGRIASLLEVGTGFHPELTGRENIYLNGAILGMARSDIERQFDEIVAFAEVEKFIDTPVKRYSSGMYLRLAFAVAAHLNPEILVIDEVLAVGDVAFQKKCLGKMGEVAQQGRTVLFVSHNMAAVRQLCQKCMWLDAGYSREIGSVTEVIDHYIVDESENVEEAYTAEQDNSKEFQLRRVRLLSREGTVTTDFECNEAILIELICQVHRCVPGLYGYLSVRKNDGMEVMVSDSYDSVPNPLDELPLGTHVLQVTIPPRSLAPGSYSIYINFASPSGMKGFDVDSPGTICSFQLADWTSRRGNQRPGFFSTLLSWEIDSTHQSVGF